MMENTCVCPNCGYCPHCGRGPIHTIPWNPYYPVYPSPIYPQPIWYGTPYTVTTNVPSKEDYVFAFTSMTGPVEFTGKVSGSSGAS